MRFQDAYLLRQRGKRLPWWLSAPLAAFVLLLFALLLAAYVEAPDMRCPAPECFDNPTRCGVSLEAAAADRERNLRLGNARFGGC